MASSSSSMSEVYDGQRLTLDGYLSARETNRRHELAFGVVREPPAPNWDHQFVIGRLFARLDQHSTRFKLGKVGLSPLDVILDPARSLVVQPDLVFVATARCAIIRDRIWGPPDLVVEVLSPDTGRYDREQKRGWYEEYGVREQWLVDPRDRTIDVCDLIHAPAELVSYTGRQFVRSRVLPRLRLRVSSAFE
jgi:Uma2 family endonuclease